MSLAATLRGQEPTPRPFLYREFAGYGGWQAVWVDTYKLVRRQLQDPAKAATELYDLAVDPRESKNLATAAPERVAAMQKVLGEQHTPSPTFPLAAVDGKAK